MRKYSTLLSSMLLCAIFFQNVFAQSETEPNNWAMQATEANFGQAASGSLTYSGYADQADWWKIVTTGTGLLTFDFLTSIQYLYADLYYEDDTIYRVTYAIGANTMSFPVHSGVYYLRLTVSGEDGTYLFTPTLITTYYETDPDEPNGVLDSAVTVTGNPFTGTIGYYTGIATLAAGLGKYDIADWWSLTTSPGDITFYIEKQDADYLHVDVYNADNTIPGAYLTYANMVGIGSSTITGIGGSGDYRIKVWNESTYGSYQITYSVNTGITDAALKDCTIYPNPSNGKFIVIHAPICETQTTILNLLGEKVYASAVNAEKTEIDLRSQPAGIYFATITSEKGTARRTIVIE